MPLGWYSFLDLTWFLPFCWSWCTTGMELRMTTSTRLKTCLYSFTSPGGPMYPTRAVRHAAWEALDLLFPVSVYTFFSSLLIHAQIKFINRMTSVFYYPFPKCMAWKFCSHRLLNNTLASLANINFNAMIQVGRYPRHLISLFFRLLYPWYWPSSCWNFAISCVKAVFFSLLRFIFSWWDKFAKSKSY